MSRRRKQQTKGRSHQHSGTCGCQARAATSPDGWPDATEVERAVDLDVVTLRLLDDLTADSIYGVMQRMPSHVRQYLLRGIGLQSVSSYNRGMAGQVLARIRSDARPSKSSLLQLICAPVATLFDSDLTAEQWAAVLGPDPTEALNVLSDERRVARTLTLAVRTLEEPLRSAGLVSAIASDTAAAAAALTLLAVNDDSARRAHTELQAIYPALPPVPTTDLEAVLPLARIIAIKPGAGHRLDDADDLDMLDDLFDDLDSAPEIRSNHDTDDDADCPPASDLTRAEAAQVLLDLTGDVIDGWSDAVESAEAIVSALRAGLIWDDELIDTLLDWEGDALGVGSRLSTFFDEPITATRDNLAAALPRLAAEAQGAQEWLVALTSLHAPDAAKQSAEFARRAAASALETPADADLDALRALHTLIVSGMRRRSGEPIDYAEVAQADSLVRQQLPDVVPLLLFANYGEVTVATDTTADTTAGPAVAITDDIPGETHAQQRTADRDAAAPPADLTQSQSTTDSADVTEANTTAAGTTGPDTTSADDNHQPLPDDKTSDTSTDDSAEDTDNVRGHTTADTAATGTHTPTEPATPTPAAAAEPSSTAAASTTDAAPTDAAPTDEPPADPEQDDLDALLAAGAARELSSLTGARRTSRPSAPATRTAPTGSVPLQPSGPGTPAFAEHTTTDSPQPDDAALTIEIDEVLPVLLGTGRYALAADLLESSGAPEASVAARRLAAYATALRHPTGEVASAFASDSVKISRDDLGDDRAGHLLAWAAAARISILSPSAGPADVLLNLAPSVAGNTALSEVGQALIEASRSGIVVLPETAGAVGSLAATESAAVDLAREAAELLGSAPTRNIKYIPANGVYQSWMQRNGQLGELLSLVATNDVGNASKVSDSVVALRGRGDKSIDETFAVTRRSRNHHNKILAGARTTLISRWDEAVDLAGRWAEAAERAAEQSARLHAGAWQAGPLNNLRARLSDVRDFALRELTEQADTHTGDASAAARVAAAMLADTFAACDGAAATGDEQPVSYIAHGELLASDLPLTARTLLPTSGLNTEHVPALLAIARQPRAPHTQVYAHRAARGDHDLTLALLAGIRPTDPRTAQALDRRRTADIADIAATVSTEVAALRSDIDTQRMSGAFDDGPWSALSSRVQALDEATRTDFGRIRTEAQRIRHELAEHQTRKIEQTVARITARSAASATVAAAAETLTDLARTGQIASAEEYLEQVVAGGQLPSNTTQADHLAAFFPSVPDLYSRHGDLPTQLHAALAGSPPSTPVLDLVRTAGTEFPELGELRRAAGTRALGAWAALTPGSKGFGKVDAPSALRAVLAQAGLEFADQTLDPGGNQTGRHWITLRGVTGNGHALVPALGSAMSPDGATLLVLLVRSAPTPATVLEWMSHEPADHTVLALWLGKPLTAADRRAIADAARGRTRPPVVFLDAAALGYLICQQEPRLSTFAATTLPLTALSPFRDTPGDAPPEMFYGRTEEMDAVLDLSGSSVVYGGRQLGKSALLRAAAARFEASGPQRHAVERAIFTVGSEETHRDPSRLWDALWPRLAQRGIVPETTPDGELAEAVHDHILAWLDDDPSRALLVLLDEADAFLDADAIGNRFTHVDWCRRIMLDSRRRAKFVFAGLHRTARFESLPNQPLSHLGKPVSVGPLRPQHAYDLLTKPLAAMGFRFTDPIALPARVLALANNMPALLQLFGAALVAHLTARPVGSEGPPYLITDDDIDAVFADSDLREAFRQKYQLTINLDHRYMVIAYVIAEAAHDSGVDASLSLTELADACRQAWPAGFSGMAADDFRGLVTECVDLGVLAEDDGRYRVRTPTVLRLLGTEEHVLDVLYKRTEEMSAPSATDAASYRRRVGQTRSPFTERQLGQLFSSTSRVLVVAGSQALGAQRALAALEHARDDGAARMDYFSRCHTVTPDGLRRDIGKVTGNRPLLVADATRLNAAALRDLLHAADDDVAQDAAHHPERRLTVVLLTGPGNAAGWVDWPERMELTRVDGPGLRLWCDEDNLPFRDDESVADLLRASGGWPHVIARIAENGDDTPVGSSSRMLDDLNDWLRGPGAAALTQAAELTDGILSRAFLSLAAVTADGGGDIDTLTELLEVDGLSPDDVQQAGYDNLRQVVIALRVLGCLVSADDGLLHAERVLSAAAQAHLVERADA